ncbi:MAG: GIY-YIG nuclease family protein [Bacteroidales bacterium]|nr:GIY-YIG nuclease family protein [Bacteroidales bacterium]
MYYVYILQSKKDGKYYIGYTSDLDARVDYHNSGQQRLTRHRIPFELIYFEEYKTKKETRDQKIFNSKFFNSTSEGIVKFACPIRC